MSDRIHVIDGAIPYPEVYLASVLKRTFETVDVGAQFHGISLDGDQILGDFIASVFDGLVPELTFYRKSPATQVEPNYIHTDCDMGEWTAILYLTPNPPIFDGTTFWKHVATGAIETKTGATSEANLAETLSWRDRSQWEPWRIVAAEFNRVVVFPASYYHSRAIEANYGAGDSARLIQVLFGTGMVPERVSV